MRLFKLFDRCARWTHKRTGVCVKLRLCSPPFSFWIVTTQKPHANHVLNDYKNSVSPARSICVGDIRVENLTVDLWGFFAKIHLTDHNPPDQGRDLTVHTLQVISESVTCEASCPHCAHQEGKGPAGGDLFDSQKFKKARQFALQSGAVAMEIDAKGDPLLGEWTHLYQILSEASPEFAQIGLITPGKDILPERESFLNLVGRHLTNLTLTLPHHQPKKRKALLGLNVDYETLVSYLTKECDLVVRAACFLSKQGVSSPEDALDFVRWCRQIGIQQVVFKEIGIPDESVNEQVAKWCLENAVELDLHENWNFDDPGHALFYVNSLVAQNQARPVFVFPWGETVYDIEGVNVVFEKSEKSYYGKFIKSLVFSNNHLYARWESPGTILF